VVDRKTIHNITNHNKRIRSYAVDLDEGQWLWREVVRKGGGDEGKW
jgi:hypothetical protein